MLDDVGLVHMNGRLYDPALGRMCAADPYVQTPENLQNYNRYSYVLNNPLSQVDPSGHFIVEAIVAIVAAVLAVIAAVISTVVAFVAYLAMLAAQFVVTVISAVGQALGAIGSALMSAAKAGVAYVAANLTMGKVLLGAALGAIYNGAQVAINGGSFSQILKSAAIGAVTGAVGAVLGAFLQGFGEAIGGELAGAGLGETGGKVMGKAVHAGAHGAVSGGMSAAQGGSFKDGFIGSLIGTGVSVATGYALGGVMNDIGIVGRTAVAAISGGTASALTGGKFADGAYSAAFMHLFMTEVGQRPKARSVKTYSQATSVEEQRTALRTAFDLIGKAWNLPNTVIGFAWGGVGFVAEIMMYPFTLSWNFRVSLGYNAVQFEGHNLAGTAETFGNVISYADYNYPDTPIPEEGHTVGQHEMMHTYQGQQLGVLYLPAVLISYGFDFVMSGPSSMFHGPWSFIERGPQTYAKNKPWNFSRDYISPY
jgi:RHS repeat-associated protein